MKTLWFLVVFVGFLKPSFQVMIAFACIETSRFAIFHYTEKGYAVWRTIKIPTLPFQRSYPTDDSYVAAVMEYAYVSNATVNLENYLKYISDAALQNADIVVFPELTLRSPALQVPIYGDLLLSPIPYLNISLYDPVLVSLSRAAAEHEIYVLVQLEEFVNCLDNRQSELCPESKIYYFNANVVFDRKGAVIDRYRKINLSVETTRTPALNRDLGVFSTDFGVTFGHFISFDLMFQVPAVQVVQKLNITDVIFTAMWFSALPYLTAIQIQQGFAYSLNINMLASGANNVLIGSAGSGIFSGTAGALVSTMPGLPTSSLLVARVPKVPGHITNLISPSNVINPINSLSGPIAAQPEDVDELFIIKDPSIISHVTRLLQDGFQEFVLSDNDVNCMLRVNMTHGETETVIKRYRYRAAAFDGTRTFAGVATGGVRVCSVIECTNEDLTSCGERFPQYLRGRTATFSELTITAIVPTPRWQPDIGAYDTFYVPVSVDTSIQSLQPEEFTFTVTQNGDKTTYFLSLNSFSRELYSFAVWGRVYERDGQDATPPSSSSVMHNSGVLSLVLGLLIVISQELA